MSWPSPPSPASELAVSAILWSFADAQLSRVGSNTSTGSNDRLPLERNRRESTSSGAGRSFCSGLLLPAGGQKVGAKERNALTSIPQQKELTDLTSPLGNIRPRNPASDESRAAKSVSGGPSSERTQHTKDFVVDAASTLRNSAEPIGGPEAKAASTR